MRCTLLFALSVLLLVSCATPTPGIPTVTPFPSATPTPTETATPTPQPVLVFPAIELSAEYLSGNGSAIADGLDDLRSTSPEAWLEVLETSLGLTTAVADPGASTPICSFSDCFGKWWGKAGIDDFDLANNPEDVLDFAVAGAVWQGPAKPDVVSWVKTDDEKGKIGFEGLSFFTEQLSPSAGEIYISQSGEAAPSNAVIHRGARVVLIGRGPADKDEEKGKLALAVTDTSAKNRAGIYYLTVSDEEFDRKIASLMNDGLRIWLDENDLFSFRSNGKTLEVQLNSLDGEVMAMIERKAGALWAEKYLSAVTDAHEPVYTGFENPNIPFPDLSWLVDDEGKPLPVRYLSAIDHGKTGFGSFTGYAVREEFLSTREYEELNLAFGVSSKGTNFDTDPTGLETYKKAREMGMVVDTVQWGQKENRWVWGWEKVEINDIETWPEEMKKYFDNPYVISQEQKDEVDKFILAVREKTLKDWGVQEVDKMTTEEKFEAYKQEAAEKGLEIVLTFAEIEQIVTDPTAVFPYYIAANHHFDGYTYNGTDFGSRRAYGWWSNKSPAPKENGEAVNYKYYLEIFNKQMEVYGWPGNIDGDLVSVINLPQGETAILIRMFNKKDEEKFKLLKVKFSGWQPSERDTCVVSGVGIKTEFVNCQPGMELDPTEIAPWYDRIRKNAFSNQKEALLKMLSSGYKVHLNISISQGVTDAVLQNGMPVARIVFTPNPEIFEQPNSSSAPATTPQSPTATSAAPPRR